MRVAVTDDHEKGSVGILRDELPRLRRHEGHVAIARTLRRQLLIERQSIVRKDVLLADECSPVARGAQKLRQRAHRRQQVLVVHVVRESIHPVRVRIQAGVDHGATRTARRHGGECIGEQRAARSEPIQVRSPQHWIAIRREVASLIVGNDQQHVAGIGDSSDRKGQKY